MNVARAQARLKGMTALAQRVYEAVPIAAPWSTTQIQAELVRVGARLDKHVFLACLMDLRDSRLVTEKSRGMYQRSPLKDKPAIEERMPVARPALPVLPAPTPAKTSPLDLLGALSSRLRTLADEVDAAALAIDAQMAANQEDMTKLKQLQSLLKSIGG